MQSQVLTFVDRLLEISQKYKASYDEASLGVYLQAILQIIVEGYGLDDLESFASSSLSERFALLVLKLEPIHQPLKAKDTSFVEALLTDVTQNTAKLEGVPPEVIVYASLRKHYFLGDFLAYITDRDYIIDELAEKFDLSEKKMRLVLGNFQKLHPDFNVYLYRRNNYEEKLRKLASSYL